MKNYSLSLYENKKKRVEIIIPFEDTDSACWFFQCEYIHRYCKRLGIKQRFFNMLAFEVWKYSCLNIGKSKFILKEL